MDECTDGRGQELAVWMSVLMAVVVRQELAVWMRWPWSGACCVDECTDGRGCSSGACCMDECTDGRGQELAVWMSVY